MDLQSFTSIFEIFTAFNLAYVIIDEVTENTYVTVVADRVLRKFDEVNACFKKVNASIEGTHTSISNLPDVVAKKHTDGLQDCRVKLEGIRHRSAQAHTEIKNTIKKNNLTTRAFVYLTSFLFLYCLAVLFIAGCYGNADQGSDHDIRLDNSLFLLEVGTLVFLLLGWWFDQKKKTDRRRKKFLDQVYDSNLFNGYKITFISFIVITGLVVCEYWYKWMDIDFSPNGLHNSLIMVAVVLPVSNFLVYVLKANTRANREIGNLNEKAAAFEHDFMSELRTLDDYIGACRSGFSAVEISNPGRK
jgi:hypothetical protein